MTEPIAPPRGENPAPRISPIRDCVHLLCIAGAALLALLPLLVHGPSCGHDFSFHLQSWMEVESQWRAGIAWPRWALHAAWNAGEPRFVFYPPLSWLLGAALTRMLPFGAVPATYTGIALFLSGCAMRRLARHTTSAPMATFAGCLYLANPYMLFVAYERTAYAELLAAAWMPLLLAAILRPRLDPLRLALAVALLWLTNAPAAVAGCYALLLLGSVRFASSLLRPHRPRAAFGDAGALVGGAALGVACAAFYILPAAFERRFVQISMAILPGLRPEDNFLFGHTADPLHTAVLRTASWTAVSLLLTAFGCGAALLYRKGHDARAGGQGGCGTIRQVTLRLVFFSAAVLFLLLPVSAAVWRHAPELLFLQFPWRFLAVESGIAVLLLALALPAMRARLALPFALGFALIAGQAADRSFRQACDEADGPSAQRQLFLDGAGTEATDEYTPVSADNDELAHTNPVAWLTRTNDGSASSPGMPGNAQALAVQSRPGQVEVQLGPLPAAAILVIRLRAFPGWRVLDNGTVATNLPERNDGLIAIPLGTGQPHRIQVTYIDPADQRAGLAVSVLAIAFFSVLVLRRKAGSRLQQSGMI